MHIKKDIHGIALYIQDHIDRFGNQVWKEHQQQLLHQYEKMGDSAYGKYLGLLLQPVHQYLKSHNINCRPQLPGDLSISREWGADESDRQRWMWSTLKQVDGTDIGTIVVKVFHDHTQFRIPRNPVVLSLVVTGKQKVIRELSDLSTDFSEAMDMKAEYAAYVASLATAR